ncbi:TAM domain methyltransferase [Colletotrichum tabaci]|uniref:TAM domain methyltransferase n=1 Tax=Colletotrichum tabaci TaxID=1209068 RepID=A0AAV9SVM7_9PEZI
MDKHSLQRLRKSGRSASPVGRLPLRPSTAANSVSAASTSTRLTASSSSERTRNPSTESDGRPRTPPSTRPSMNSGQQDDYADDHPSPTSDEVSRALWTGASDSDDGSDDATPASSFRTATPIGTGKSRSKDTRSIFQSIFNKFAKTGRRFGFVPNSKEEQDRNVLQHQIIAELFDGRLHLAPVVKPRAALDVGTGPGLWALKNPNCAVVGIDIEKVRPPYTAPNCQFKLMDATADWALDKQFDYIHVRMLGDIVDKEKFIQSIYDQLNPGGWVEFTEWIPVLQSPDRSLDGTSFQKWNRLLGQGLENMGRDIRYVQEYRPLLEKAGFERMKLTKHAAPTNSCYPGKKCQRFGAMMVSNWNAIIEPLSVPIFTIGLGWSEAQVQVLLKKVRKEIEDTRYHSFMTL